jgi:hypothetical protein
MERRVTWEVLERSNLGCPVCVKPARAYALFVNGKPFDGYVEACEDCLPDIADDAVVSALGDEDESVEGIEEERKAHESDCPHGVPARFNCAKCDWTPGTQYPDRR